MYAYCKIFKSIKCKNVEKVSLTSEISSKNLTFWTISPTRFFFLFMFLSTLDHIEFTVLWINCLIHR